MCWHNGLTHPENFTTSGGMSGNTQAPNAQAPKEVRNQNDEGADQSSCFSSTSVP
jgi:hypothetical protein